MKSTWPDALMVAFSGAILFFLALTLGRYVLLNGPSGWEPWGFVVAITVQGANALRVWQQYGRIR